MQKIWAYRDIDENEVDRLAEGAGISRLLAKVFVSRGITADTVGGLSGGDSAGMSSPGGDGTVTTDAGGDGAGKANVDGDSTADMETVSAGISGIEYVRNFLEPDLSRLHDPFLMDGMELAVPRILRAVDAQEDILIYGDYDVDGVTATSILYNFLRSRGARVRYFIPDRLEDGYGLTMSSAEKVRQLGPKLVVTVDCGITSAEEVRFLTEAGIDVIVTDHHECKEILPEAAAVMNPHKPGCGYPFKELCGAGIAFKLVQAICIREADRNDAGGAAQAGLHDEAPQTCRADDYLKYIDLAGLATIADIVPLLDENRIIASFGLKAMQNTRNPGMAALIKAAGYGGKEITSFSAAFGLAPRVNAAGRLGSAERSVRLFTTDDRVLAEALAKELDDENRQRQETENRILKEAVSFVEKNLDPVREKVLVVYGEGWHHGVVGIVSSKITERYNRPSLIISVDEEGNGKGSGRSIKGFNLFKALTFCGDLLDRFGGHEMAAGISIQTSRIEELRRRINEYADSVLTDADMLPCLRVDAFVGRGEITEESVREIGKMAPFGESNPNPYFGYMAMKIADIKTLSGGKHLKLRLTDGSFSVDAIGFGLGELAGQYSAGDAIDAVFTPDINVWNGTEKVQLYLRDIKPCVFTNLDKNIVFKKSNDYNNIIVKILDSLKGHYRLCPPVLIPERQELEAVYRYVRSGTRTAGGGFTIDDLYGASAQLSEKYNIEMNVFKLKRSLEIFEELGLIAVMESGAGSITVRAAENAQKVELGSSRLYTGLQDARKLFY
jgi:single-stranded-DNA-specific exonuclease